MYIGTKTGHLLIADNVKMVMLSILGEQMNQSNSIKAIIPLMVDTPEQEVVTDTDADSSSIEVKSVTATKVDAFFLSINIGYNDLMRTSNKSKGKMEKDHNSMYILCWSSAGWA